MADNSFSLDLGERYTRIADVKQVGDQLEMVSLGVEKSTPFYIASDSEKLVEEQAEVISGLYKRLKITKKNVNVVIPDAYTYSQIIEMPKLREKELLAAIRYQADEFIPMPIDETVLDLEIIKENEAKKTLLILIVASPKKLIEQIGKTIELAHLFPETLENELSAVGRMISGFMKQKTAGATLYVNFGYTSTSIYLVDNNSSLIILVRTFKMGLDLFIKDLKVNLNWDEAKIEEVLQSIGLSQNASYNIEGVVSPLVKELLNEIEKFVILSKEKYSLTVGSISLFNLDSYIAGLAPKIEQFFSVPTQSFTLKNILRPSPLTQSYANKLSLFIPVIAGSIR